MLSSLTDHEVLASQFLRVAHSGALIASLEDLRRWLAGEVQAVLPHDALLAASGDFRQGVVRLELATGLPAGMLTAARLPAAPASLMPLLRALHEGWVAARHAPCPVNLAAHARMDCSPGLCGAWVHGTRDPSPAGERLVATLHAQPAYGTEAEARALALRLLVPFIDAALRRLSLAASPIAPKAPSTPQLQARGPERPVCGAATPLSEREHQIMAWVAMGKTNPEIGCILCISEFTVKNHLKSIFSKLDVTNRAQAVAKLTRLTPHA